MPLGRPAHRPIIALPKCPCAVRQLPDSRQVACCRGRARKKRIIEGTLSPGKDEGIRFPPFPKFGDETRRPHCEKQPYHRNLRLRSAYLLKKSTLPPNQDPFAVRPAR